MRHANFEPQDRISTGRLIIWLVFTIIVVVLVMATILALAGAT